MSRTEILTLVKDIVTLLVAIAGLIIAGIGLSTWKRTIKGNSDYQLAKNLLIAAYRIRDALKHVRSPFMSAGEQIDAAQKAGLPVPTDGDDDRRSILTATYEQRWQRVITVKTDLNISLYEAEAMWGQSIVTTTKPLFEIIFEFGNDLGEWLSYKSEQRHLMSPHMIEELKRLDKIIYARGAEDDINKKIDKAVSAIEAALHKYIR